jgi:hypothetical protein
MSNTVVFFELGSFAIETATSIGALEVRNESVEDVLNVPVIGALEVSI